MFKQSSFVIGTWLSLTVALILFVSALLLQTGCSQKGTNDVVDDNQDDKTPPAAIADLHVVHVTTRTATLGWTAPGDDGNVGCAHEYDLRGSLDSITESNFAQGYRIDSVVFPIPAGLVQVCTLEELDPGTSYYFAVKTRDAAGNWSNISNCVRADCLVDLAVSIQDAALDSIVREHIGLAAGDIHVSDIDTVTELWCDEAGISDLSGLEYFTAMGVIHLSGNNISDLSPLQGLVSLWGLGIGANPITDLSPLAGLVNLVQISVGQSPVSDITPLADLIKLSWVRLNATDVTDFSPLYGLPNLEELDIHSNQLGDIAFLTNFTHLKIASLSSNQLSDLTPLTGMISLERVYLTFNQIIDLSSLSGLPNLIEVDLRYNQIVDIAPLVNNSGLGTGDVVMLQNNSLSSVSINTYIPALQARGVNVAF